MAVFRVLFVALVAGCLGCRSDEETPRTVKAEAPKAMKSFEGQTDVEYPVPGRSPQSMTIFKPDKARDLHRALILIHGGGWVSGSRLEMEPICRFLSSRGFTAATIDYTLAGPGSRWPAQLLDVQAAVRYIRTQATKLGIDPKQVGAAGVSAGGHLSMWLGVTDAPVGGVSSHVQAVGSISGVLDLTKPLTPVGEGYRIVQKLLADDENPSIEQKRKASPVFLLCKDSPPVFLIQGKDDPWVPPDQSANTEVRLKSLGRPATLLIVDGMGHGLDVSQPPQAKALDAMSKWFKATLVR